MRFLATIIRNSHKDKMLRKLDKISCDINGVSFRRAGRAGDFVTGDLSADQVNAIKDTHDVRLEVTGLAVPTVAAVAAEIKTKLTVTAPGAKKGR